jgi:hypothetical protein
MSVQIGSLWRDPIAHFSTVLHSSNIKILKPADKTGHLPVIWSSNLLKCAVDAQFEPTYSKANVFHEHPYFEVPSKPLRSPL